MVAEQYPTLVRPPIGRIAVNEDIGAAEEHLHGMGDGLDVLDHAENGVQKSLFLMLRERSESGFTWGGLLAFSMLPDLFSERKRPS